MEIEKIQSVLDKLKGRKEQLDGELREFLVEKRLAEKNRVELDKCMKLLAYISTLNQDRIIGLFEHTVSSGLKDLFDCSYDFRFLRKSRGNSSACDFEVSCSTFPGWSDIKMSHGKSVQDIISAILRIILIKLDSKSRKIIILDEPLTGVEPDRLENASKLLHEVCSRFEIQLIVVSHRKQLQEEADKVIRTTQ